MPVIGKGPLEGKASSRATKLVEHLKSLPDFVHYTEIDGKYGHLGATLADAVLQSNNDYERNVRPRIKRILSCYGNYSNLSGLNALLKTVNVQNFLHWNGERKPQTFLDLVDLLGSERVDTEDDFRSWLQRDDARGKLIAIKYIGPKTADYLKILVGLQAAAVDRHLLGFLAEAGFLKLDYLSAQNILLEAAALLDVNCAHLDHSIWQYMSRRSVGKASCKDQ